MGTIKPCIWFDGRVREAVEFYTALFPDSSIVSVNDGADGEAFTAEIIVSGQPMQFLNGGPMFPLTAAFSFVYPCADQAELDHFWDALVADGGEESQCGWLRDRFGLSWQIIPADMGELICNQTAMDAMFTMTRIDIAALEAARDSHGEV